MGVFYMKHVRSALPSGPPECEFFFVTHKGTQVDTSTLTQAISGPNGMGFKVNCTKLRKMSSTAMGGAIPEEGAELAELMKHDEKTAKKYYRLSQRAIGAGRSSNILRKLITGKRLSKEDMKKRRTCIILIRLTLSKYSCIHELHA